MATIRTVSLPLPSSQRGFGRGERVQRFLMGDRALGYLFLFPAILVIVSLVAYPFASAIVMKSAGTGLVRIHAEAISTASKIKRFIRPPRA